MLPPVSGVIPKDSRAHKGLKGSFPTQLITAPLKYTAHDFSGRTHTGTDAGASSPFVFGTAGDCITGIHAFFHLSLEMQFCFFVLYILSLKSDIYKLFLIIDSFFTHKTVD